MKYLIKQSTKKIHNKKRKKRKKRKKFEKCEKYYMKRYKRWRNESENIFEKLKVNEKQSNTTINKWLQQKDIMVKDKMNDMILFSIYTSFRYWVTCIKCELRSTYTNNATKESIELLKTKYKTATKILGIYRKMKGGTQMKY